MAVGARKRGGSDRRRVAGKCGHPATGQGGQGTGGGEGYGGGGELPGGAGLVRQRMVVADAATGVVGVKRGRRRGGKQRIECRGGDSGLRVSWKQPEPKEEGGMRVSLKETTADLSLSVTYRTARTRVGFCRRQFWSSVLLYLETLASYKSY